MDPAAFARVFNDRFECLIFESYLEITHQPATCGGRHVVLSERLLYDLQVMLELNDDGRLEYRMGVSRGVMDPLHSLEAVAASDQCSAGFTTKADPARYTN